MSKATSSQDPAAQRKDMESNSDKLGTMPVGRLLFTMAGPMIVAMIIQALYNIVDSIYVARISEDALTAVSLAFPMQALMIAVSTGLGVGINSSLSRSLGERNPERAGHIALNGLFLILIGTLIFSLGGIRGAGLFMRTQVDDPAIAEGGTQYLTICMVFSCFQFF